jgi:KDO2-lipid IV(A) lauroyltransferase
MGVVESALAFWGRDSQLLDLAEIDGWSHLDRALSGGKGALILMAHYTPVELACRLVNREAYQPARMLARRHNNRLLETLFERGRSRHSGPTLEKKDLIGLRRALRDNQAVFYAPDQNFTYQSVFAPFFGIPAATVTATADIVKRSGAALVPLWCQRLDDGGYRIRFEPPWEDFPDPEPEVNAARVNAWIESRVRQAPEQYLWLHRRFKSRPEGEPPFYPERARRPKDRGNQ